MSADKQESLYSYQDSNWRMQYEESIYNCAVVRIDLITTTIIVTHTRKNSIRVIVNHECKRIGSSKV
ncbi:MAG: hypothetical protein M3299_18185 [Thermoproteota archaeon]|nr:hypothetical protein [Thermoproteota archaeon]